MDVHAASVDVDQHRRRDLGVADLLDQLGCRVREQVVQATSSILRLRVDRYAPCWSLSADQPKSLWVSESPPATSCRPPATRLDKFLAELRKQGVDEVVDLVFHGTGTREAMLNIASKHLSVHSRGGHGQDFGEGDYYSTDVLKSHEHSVVSQTDGSRAYIVVFLFLSSCDKKAESRPRTSACHMGRKRRHCPSRTLSWFQPETPRAHQAAAPTPRTSRPLSHDALPEESSAVPVAYIEPM